MEKIKITIAGPRGKMGQEAVKMVGDTVQFELVSVIDYKHEGKSLAAILPFVHTDIPIYANAKDAFQNTAPDVLIDLTTPEAGFHHTKAALEFGVRPVVGTTGFTNDQIEELKQLAKAKEIGCIIAPNFAIGAVLMMKFSTWAAKYFQDIEIIEMHHDQKLDAPSGTAVKTAEMISQVRTEKRQGHPNEKETIPGARGADRQGMRIHSVRLPGLIAHQQVMFGDSGQILTIRHDSTNRASFMSGVKVSVETVMKLDHLVYGLENILE
ncbi:MAG TPA: 4-hydroxy-tetrahydrodipicolinate reductase [Bacillus sp. (in: firmicutes)]|uniref:4-hydroxy-tetrahydrodipicolinate reductase n=1 Tax=Bacillus litorisediminis TaxID=2922713 RepID=UPI001FAB93E3|nr:4-hydroxy-tetrahydrodipicolinate reductase [Bacillus litorisediminis]HWO76377.1 4-hydroxy-tetrahydrodipicolinate reductase [Bacillus sp. (in: firmicutes)]